MTEKPTYEELEKRVQELQESEIYYRTFFENVNDAILVHEIGFDGKPGKFIDVNSVALKRLGYTHDELLKLTPRDITTENGYKELSKARANVISNSAAIFETTHYARNGSPIPVESHVSIMELAGQRVAVSVVRDLSERKRAEEDLQKSEEQFRDLYDNAPVGYFEYDFQGNITRVNHTYLWMLGYTAEEVIGQPCWKFIVDEFAREQIMAKLDGVRPPAICLERTYRRKDGTTFPVLFQDRLLLDEDGHIKGIRTAIQDITERKWAEEENRRFRTISDNAVYGKAIADLQGNLLYVNQFFANIHGYKPKQLIGKHFSLFHSREQMEAADSLTASMMREGHFSPTTVWHRHKDGTEFPMLMSGILIKDDNGNPQHIAVSAIDMTAHHQADELLLESEEKHRRLFETMAQGVIYQAADGTIISANPAAERILGLSFEQMQGKTSMDPRWKMILEDGTTVPGTEHPVMIALRTGETVGPVIRGVYHPEKNSHVWLSITAIPLFQPGEIKPFQAYATFEDITERKHAEEALRESLQRLEFALQGGKLGMWDWNPQDGAVVYNDIWAQMLEYRPDEVDPTVEFFKQHVHPEDLAVVLDRLTGHVEGRLPVYESEHRFRTKSGRWLWVLDRGKIAERDKDGRPVRVTGIITDVTERKQAIKKLNEREAFIKATLDNLPVGVAVNSIDPKVNFTYMNDNFAKFYRTTREALAEPNDFWEVVYTDATFREELKKRVLEDCAGNDPEQMHWKDVPVSRPGKKPFYITAKNIPLIGSNLMVSTVWDVTERKQTEMKLVESEALLEATGRMARVGGWQLEVETMAVTWTKETYRIHEVPPDYKPPLDKAIEFFHPDDRALLSQAIQRAIDRCEPYDMELRFITAKGNNLWTRTTCQPEVVGGETVRLRGTFQDITERKQAEAEQEKLQTQLIQAQKMESVGRLAGGVAHDFNNMLNIILGNTEMAMEDMAPDDPMYENLGEIFSAARRSADITRQLLAFARKQTIAPKVLDLNSAIKKMLKMLPRLIGEDIGLAWLPGANVWPVNIDPSQIDQILANLCVNARDAITDVGKITIETGKATFDSAYCADHPGFIPGDFVLLAVSDNGCGMDKDTLDNLFEPFFTTKDVNKGTGLGLATVYGIVKQNNGFINVYSEPGQGTTFRIYLPRYLAETESPEKKTSDKINLDGTETILLVEDEPSILRMTRMMLERNGYTVLAAGTPGEAIALAREHAGDIHMLMTDVVMPEMNGRDLAQNILSLYPDLKRLFMSGYTANVIAHHGVLDEGVQFIQKPFSRKQLAAKVREVLKDNPLKRDIVNG